MITTTPKRPADTRDKATDRSRGSDPTAAKVAGQVYSRAIATAQAMRRADGSNQMRIITA